MSNAFTVLRGRHFSRREFLAGAAAIGASLSLPHPLRADSAAKPERGAGIDEATRAALAASTLVYISPLRTGGNESRCHAEVWFVLDGDEVLVVTEPKRWRAAAIGKGLDEARLWVGDFGVWKRSNGKYKSAPSYDARARIDSDRSAHTRALESFGAKYTAGWSKWGPRFREGLASGERVLIRYQAK